MIQKELEKLTATDYAILVIASALTVFAYWLLTQFINVNLWFTTQTLGSFFVFTYTRKDFLKFKKKRDERK